jgi:small-conductance mechanosensitive channel
MKIGAIAHIAIALASVCAPLAAQAAAPPATAAAQAQEGQAQEGQAQTQTPAPIALAQVAAEADAATLELRKLRSDRRWGGVLEGTDRSLPALMRDVDARARESREILSQRPSLELLRDLDDRWQAVRDTLAVRLRRLNDVAAALDRDLQSLERLDRTWSATLTLARQEKAPGELVQTVQSLLAEISAVRKTVAAQRTEALRLQARVSDLDLRVTQALQANRRARDATVDQMLSRDSAPLWYPNWRESAAERISSGAAETFGRQWVILKLYLQPRVSHALAQVALLGILSALFFGVRRRLARLVEHEPGLQRVATVVEHPIAAALVLTLLATPWIHPQAPRLLWAASGVALLVPTIVVLRRLVTAYLVAPLYAVLAFFFVDQVRAVSASIDIVPRLLLMLEMVAALAFLIWFGRKADTDTRAAAAAHRSSALRVAAMLALILCAAAAIANALGFVALANLVGNAVLGSMYVGLVLYTAVQILDALAVIAMRVRPLTQLGMVQTHRALLRQRTRRALQWIAAIAWFAYLLDRLAIRDRVLEAMGAALDAQVSLGKIAISVSAVLAFVAAIWAAFLVSRFVRFVLDEEVFPRAHLGRGIPYAIQRSVHFLIIALGFFIAMGVIGMEMTQFAILASAFTIGVGFGLQNIFNNFVSGLIVLFERPIQVGDMIQIDDAVGVVERIGIRATVVRTASRSELIVPNGKLISDRVVNWTLSGRQRVIELPISVVLQSDPAQVIAVLEEMAKQHPSVLQSPPVQAILTRTGPDWLGFELRAAIAEAETWTTVRSELAVAAIAALRTAGVSLR